MNQGGETADQMVRMTLQCIEVASDIALKIGGEATRTLASTLYAIITEQKKVRGKTSLDHLIQTEKDLKVFTIRSEDLKLFCTEAKRYGVLYSVLTEKNNTSGICEIMVKASDAPKLSRIIDKLEIATIDTKALKEAILAQQQIKKQEETKVSPEELKEAEDLIKELFDEHVNEQDKKKQDARVERKDYPFEHNLETQKSDKKPSVKEQLKEISDELKNRSKKLPIKERKPKKKIKKKVR